jgi:hypothetical protein
LNSPAILWGVSESNIKLQTPLEMVAEFDLAIRLARKAGDIPALLAQAGGAMTALEQCAATPEIAEADRETLLQTARRIGYNAAADAWPGWETPPPARTKTELTTAKTIAARTAQVSQQLGEDDFKLGNAAWLIGACDLALGDPAAALAAFRDSALRFKGFPDMHLLASGYSAIARGNGDDLNAAIAALEALGTEDSTALAEQLRVAKAVFRPAL